MCGFNIWKAGFRFGGFRRLGCWISGVMVEMVVVVGHFAGGGSYQHGFDLWFVGLICDLWLWVCFVVAVGLLVMLCWCLGGGCAAFFIFLFFYDWWFCLVWVEEKDWRFEFFFFFFLLWTGGRWWWWWWWWRLWL